MKDWKEQHKELYSDFLGYLNDVSDDYILKGGTALYLIYGLDRFSTDIDLDGTRKGLIDIVDGYCKEHDYSYRVSKDTATGERCFVHYSSDEYSRPLKIESSYRNKNINQDNVCVINGIKTYNIDTLCIQKTHAYSTRDAVRDAYDVSFIYANYKDELSPQAIEGIKSAVLYKGLSYIDYLVKTDKDDLINPGILENRFLDMYNDIGLLADEDDIDNIDNGTEAPIKDVEHGTDGYDSASYDFYDPVE